jgi:hypothetical protein
MSLTLFAAFSLGAEPDHIVPKEHPPLVELMRAADLVAIALVEIKNGVLVYRINEVLKGEYKPEAFPGMYKGTYTLYTPAKKMPEATDKALIVVKVPGKVQTNDDQLIMFVKDGSVSYPRVTAPRAVVKAETYTLEQVRASIETLPTK